MVAFTPGRERIGSWHLSHSGEDRGEEGGEGAQDGLVDRNSLILTQQCEVCVQGVEVWW